MNAKIINKFLVWWGINYSWHGIFIIVRVGNRDTWDYYLNGERIITAGQYFRRRYAKTAVMDFQEEIRSGHITWKADGCYSLSGTLLCKLIGKHSESFVPQVFGHHALKAKTRED